MEVKPVWRRILPIGLAIFVFDFGAQVNIRKVFSLAFCSSWPYAKGCAKMLKIHEKNINASAHAYSSFLYNCSKPENYDR
jgi:hypothetical protein